MAASPLNRSFRCLVFAHLELLSPLHVGGGADDRFSDQPILRDIQGRPFLPGGALAGGLACHLTDDQKRDWMGHAPAQTKQEPSASALVVDDAYPLPAQLERLRFPVELRPQVTLMRDTMTSKPDHHFNAEMLPKGTVFRLACRCDLETEQEVMPFLNTLERFLGAGGQLGAKRNSGQGRWRCPKWAYKTLHLANWADFETWMLNFHGHAWQGGWDSLSKQDFTLSDLNAHASAERWRIRLEIEIQDGLHLAAGASGLPKKGMSDLAQAKRPVLKPNGKWDQSQYIDFGSSIKGRLRSAMEMMLRTWLVRFGQQAQDIVCETVPTDPTQRSLLPDISAFFGHTGKKGAFSVEEHGWENGDPVRQDHIRLNEFTQQALRGAKFDFAPLYTGKTQAMISLAANAPDWHKALVFAACRLLAMNILPWGGHASRGYVGARIAFPDQDQFQSDYQNFDIQQWLEEQIREI